jgi:dTDP-4-amino-4,6-dideoxygalactose transaminase
MNVPFVDLQAQYQALAQEMTTAVVGVMERGDFILGGKVAEFERMFADYCGVPHAVGVDSGYSALELLVLAHGIGAGDEVITAANTFVATVLAISNTGATPILVDCHPDTYNLDPAKLEAAITPRTKAIMPVHLYGQPADMGPIMALAEKYQLVVIEDASQAHGARYEGQRVGSIGHSTAFSLYPGKNLGAYGDAGIVVTHSAEIAEKVRMLRNLGMKVKYHHEIKGFNRRLDTLQAAVLCVKLPHLDGWNGSRRRAAETYDRLLAEVPGVTRPCVPSWAEPVFHLYVIRVPSQERDGLQKHLTEQGIATGLHYPIPIHQLGAYAELPYQTGDFPITEQYASEILSLPIFPELTDEQIGQVVGAIRGYLG